MTVHDEMPAPEITPHRPAPARLPVLTWALVTPIMLWAAARLLGLERGNPFVQLMAFTPYAVLAAAVVMTVALLARRLVALIVVTLATVALLGCVAPRTIGAGSDLDGVAVRVLSLNMLAGAADAAAVVDLVRRHEVDVLALQEFTPGTLDRLDRLGLATLLPYAEAHPERDVAGSALFSRFPLTDGAVTRHPNSGFRQAAATVGVPGAIPFRVESVHPVSPADPAGLDVWEEELRAQAPAGTEGPPRVLAGDFNATLDHAEFRRLLRTGYRDAADEVGEGLRPTWPFNVAYYRGIPPVTIDHVLVDAGIGVRAFVVLSVPGTDHRPILATIVVPHG